MREIWFTVYGISKEELDKMSDQEMAVWYNDNVIYLDKVCLNCNYYRHYSFIKDIQMILCTVLGKKMDYACKMAEGRCKMFLSVIWQFCRFVFVPQRKPKDAMQG